MSRENKNFESTTSGDTVTIRKLPEVEFLGRDQQIASGNIPSGFPSIPASPPSIGPIPRPSRASMRPTSSRRAGI